jgi:hypothetical protein
VWFSDLSHLSWSLWRIIGYAIYWFAVFAAILVTAVAIPTLIRHEGAQQAIAMLAGGALWLVIGYWLRRWLTSVTSFWPWVTLTREMKAREVVPAPQDD